MNKFKRDEIIRFHLTVKNQIRKRDESKGIRKEKKCRLQNRSQEGQIICN